MKFPIPYEVPAQRMAEAEEGDRDQDPDPAERRLRILHLAFVAGGDVEQVSD